MFCVRVISAYTKMTKQSNTWASVPLHCAFWNYLIYVPINSLTGKWSLEKLNDAPWSPEIVWEDQTVPPAGTVFFMLHFFCPRSRRMEEMPSLPSLSFISCQDPTNGKLGARQLVDILHSCQAEGIKQGGEWYLSLERKKKKPGVKAPGKAYAARVVKWGIWSTGKENEVSSPYQSLGIIWITHCSCHITVLSLVQDTDTCKAESDET